MSQGFCASGDTIRVARAALHMWEEPCISGETGSGTVFFSGCNLRCIFCQNMEISRGSAGKDTSTQRLKEIFFELKDKGANNINLVTPAHFLDHIIPVLKQAKDEGLDLPIVYNTSAYEKVESIKKLKGLIDVYLPDCKYYDDRLALNFSSAPDYHKIAMNAIEEMVRQTEKCVFDDKGIIKRGVIVRHMVLPGHTADSIKVIDSLYERFGDDIYISIMSQYTPVKSIDEYSELNRRLTKREYKKVTDHALLIGLTNGFIQDGEVALESFIPAFDCEGV
jgi:putative pyruvate formate lyase activating enzyme